MIVSPSEIFNIQNRSQIQTLIEHRKANPIQTFLKKKLDGPTSKSMEYNFRILGASIQTLDQPSPEIVETKMLLIDRQQPKRDADDFNRACRQLSTIQENLLEKQSDTP